jgi:hypothetical protein
MKVVIPVNFLTLKCSVPHKVESTIFKVLSMTWPRSGGGKDLAMFLDFLLKLDFEMKVKVKYHD